MIIYIRRHDIHSKKIYSKELEEYMLIPDEDVLFIFPDDDIILAKYMHKSQYRKCKVYHVDDKPKHNHGNYTTEQFKTKSVRNMALLVDADEILDI